MKTVVVYTRSAPASPVRIIGSHLLSCRELPSGTLVVSDGSDNEVARFHGSVWTRVNVTDIEEEK